MARDDAHDELLERARRGDRVAVEAVLIREGGFLRSRIAEELRRCGVTIPSDVDDVLQEVWIRVVRGLPQFEPRDAGSWNAWLTTISVNTARTYVQRVQRRPASLPPVADNSGERWSGALLDCLLADSVTPSRVVAGREVEEELRAAISELPQEQRGAVQLRHLQGLAIEDGARQMSCSVGQFRGYLQRGLENLRASPRLRKFLS